MYPSEKRSRDILNWRSYVQMVTIPGKAWRAPRQRLYPPSAFH